MQAIPGTPPQMAKGDEVFEAETDSTACTDREAEVESGEEASPSAVVETEKSAEPADVNEDTMKLLQTYGKRFAEMRQGDIRPLVKKSFPWQRTEDLKEGLCTSDSVELGEDLDLQQANDEDYPEETDTVPGKRLALTFGYAGNLDENPPYARFDVRDHVCMRVGGFRHGQVVQDGAGQEFIVVGVKRAEGAPRLWFQPRSLRRPAAGAFPGATAAALRAKLSPVEKITAVNTRQRLSVRLREASRKDFNTAEGSDGEEVILCQHCHAPLGETAYNSDGKAGPLVHGECMAQRLLREFKDEHDGHSQAEAELKSKRRTEYDIGWKVERIPSNLAVATRLSCSPAPQGMCCLVLDKASNSVRVAPTVEPAASVNLEYLCLALQVRLREGREPVFSLDPVDPAQPGTMQFKRFEPAWLAGTSAGEVLFQADYHLKELSMGEFEQPVVGMKSCFDFSEEEGHKKEWSAREWFVVNKAEVQLSEDDVIIPYIRMGVQAREQILGADGSLEDCELTRPDHPLVKYAEAFTRNFDLIAERKSAIYHLRELAKATIMAKYLVEADVFMDEAWLQLPEESQTPCYMEVPQLWNERCHSQIRMQDGIIVNEKHGFGSSVHSVYGGVDFGLGRFRLSAAQRPSGVLTMAMSTPPQVKPHSLWVPPGFEPKKVRGQPITRPAFYFPKPALSAAPVAARPVVAPPVSRPAAPPGARAPPPVRAARPARPARPVRAARPARPAAAGVAAQGVDLNLDEFNLSAPVMDDSSGSWGANVQTALAGSSIGAAFWSSLAKDTESVFVKEDTCLLKDIFNQHLSDRREEGDRFVPPDTSFSYLEKLRGLIAQEESLRQQRKEHFFSTRFVMDDAGPLFPASWRPAFQIARGLAPVRPAGESLHGGVLHARPDYKAEALAVEHMLKSASPVFDRSTEDGIRFRIYRFGSLEVRTTQTSEGDEEIGVVFSIRASAQGAAEDRKQDRCVKDAEKVVKVTEYVERVNELHWHSYLVLETDQGNVIVTEQLKDGRVTWEENPRDLEDRNSLAKVIRSASRSNSGVFVQDMKAHRAKEQSDIGASPSKCKRYAQGAFVRAIGAAPNRVCSGFRRQAKGDKWKLGSADAQDVTGKRGSGKKIQQARYFKAQPSGIKA